MTTRDDILYFELMCLVKDELEETIAYIYSNGNPPFKNEPIFIPYYQCHKLVRNAIGNIEGLQLMHGFYQITGQPIWISSPGYFLLEKEIKFMSYRQDNNFESIDFNEGYEFLKSSYANMISIYSSSDFNDVYPKYCVGISK